MRRCTSASHLRSNPVVLVRLLSLSIPMLFACDPGSAGTNRAAAFAVRDSAGIAIVESNSPFWSEGEGWTVSAEPLVEIGMLDGPEPYLFDEIASATRLPSGSFFQVGTFAPSNTEMTTFGGIMAYRLIANEVARTDIRLGLVLDRGAREVVLGRFPYREYEFVRGPTRMSSMGVENDYFPGARYAVERDPVRAHIATPGRREIRTYDADGRLTRILRQRIRLAPLTDALIDAARQAVQDSATRRDDIPVGDVMALFDQIEFPDSVFPFSALHADADGNLWALEHEPGSDDGLATYQVFDARGVWLGPVHVPSAFGTIEEIGDDYLLAIRTDEFDVPYFRLHTIVKDPNR